MTAPFAVTVFRCGNCRSRHDTEEAAEKCCICKCGRTIPREDRRGFSVSGECPFCRSRGYILRQSARVRKLKEELKLAEDHLESLRMKHEEMKDGEPKKPRRAAS